MRLIALALLGLVLAGCAPVAVETPQTLEPDTSLLTSEYRIGVGDVIRVNVWRNPDLDIEVPVRPDGMISVPLAGDVMAGGRTTVEVSATISDLLSRFIRDPKVAVIPIDIKSTEFMSRIRVTGAVEEPITLPYSQGITVLDAVLAAGGVNQFAAPEKSKLYRTSSEGEVKVYAIDLRALLENGGLQANFELQPGDTITVPERGF